MKGKLYSGENTRRVWKWWIERVIKHVSRVAPMDIINYVHRVRYQVSIPPFGVSYTPRMTYVAVNNYINTGQTFGG